MDPVSDVHAAHLLALRRLIPELQSRHATRLGFGHAGCSEGVGPFGDVELDLTLDVARNPVGAEDVENAMVPCHEDSSPQNVHA